MLLFDISIDFMIVRDNSHGFCDSYHIYDITRFVCDDKCFLQIRTYYFRA